MVNDDPVAAVRRAVGGINDRSTGERAAGLLAPSVVRHDLVELFSDSHGSEGASDFVTMITAAMPDFRLDIEDIFGAGDRATVRLRISGTHTGAPLLRQPATGRRLSASAVFIYRATGGRLAEAWQIVDGLAFYRLAGLIDYGTPGCRFPLTDVTRLWTSQYPQFLHAK
jgi:predicted ester cyclase